MSIKADRPQVRTAEQLERKYNFATMEKNIKQSDVGLTKVSNELYEFVKAVAGDTETLEKQLDGTIETWYGDGTPTLSNEPAVDWDTSDERAAHVEDLYYDRETGLTYVFTENGGTYSWEETNRNFLAEILALANNAKETADGKKVVFTSQPEPPYDNGDLWLNNGKLYVCQFARLESDTYHDQDFVEATNYVDGTQATAIADEKIEVFSGQVTRMIQDNNQVIYDFEKNITDSLGNQLDEIHNYIQFIDGDIVLKSDNSVYVLRIENDRIVIYKNNNGTLEELSSWKQYVFTASQINIDNKQVSSTFAFIPRDNGSLSFRKIK